MAEATRVAGQLLFQNSLAEVVRKLRSTSKSEAEVIEQCIAETRKEITSTVQSVKVTAVLKAVYFSMLGYSAAYGAFNIIEVMADKLFANKRTGYMAACLTFTPKTDVLPLMTALLKRDLASANHYEVGLALYCIASVCTPDLAKDLVVDVVNLLNHPRSYVRKKAVLSLYRVFFEYPDSLRPTYPRLKEKLDDHSERCDNDPAVRGAVVCVLCELARRNPANFLGLAVPFFSMLSTVHSNWTLIKIVKVFGYFAPLEPRLGKKLVEPVTNLIHTTGAKSVQYECILAVANGMSKVASLTKLAAEKVKLFIEDADQNLKYLGLDAMSRMMVENPKLLSDQRDIIIACLDDADSTIRRKALEILHGLLTKRNIVSTVNSMMERCVRTPPDEDWSNRVIATVVEVAQTDDYALVPDFEWYTGVLLDISLVNLSTYQHGGLVQREFVTVLTRVNAVRQFGVNALSQLLSNTTLLNCDATLSTQWEVIKAAAFLCGEYPYWLEDIRHTCAQLLSDRIAVLPPEAQVMCVAAVGKIAAYVHQPCQRHLALCNGEEELTLPEDPVTDDELREVILPPQHFDAADKGEGSGNGCGRLLHQKQYVGLQLFRHSIHSDVQERANLVFYQVDKDPDLGPCLCAEELLPVAVGAQDAVELPEGLDLDEPFCSRLPELMQLSDSEEDDGDDDEGIFDDGAERQRWREQARRGEVAAFYIKEQSLAREGVPVEVELETVTAASLQLQDVPRQPRKTQTINRELSRPVNYVPATQTRRQKEHEEEVDEATRKFRNVDVTRALAANEKLPETIPYTQLLQLRSAASPAKAAEEAAAAAEAEVFEPVVLLDERYLRVTLSVEPCRLRKDGTRLAFCVEVTNLASSSSVYNVTLRVQHDEQNYTEQIVRLDPDEPHSSSNNNNNNNNNSSNNDNENGATQDEMAENVVHIADRIKGSSSVRKESAIKFVAQLLVSFAEPLPFTLTYTRDKKPTTASLLLPLRYGYFAKAPKDTTPAEFTETVLGRLLLETSVVESFVAISASRVPLALPLILQKLRLRTVEVFKDAVSLHGVLHARKSTSDAAHVAALLWENIVDGEKGIGIAVKARQLCLAELLVQEIAALLLEEAA
uniref:AP-3 complex subunit delta n=1 Tax=Trypanosoma grayi TaxID=71804 RepID=M4T038_9TRYP|nr:AP-3 complex subunit delta [Trypanosoma grayi]